MRKNIFKIICVVMGSILTSSCSDYLDVQPEDKLLEDQVYGNEAGIRNVLNGVYMDLSGESLYGGSLTMSGIELLAQRYSMLNSSSSYYNYVNYNYGEDNIKSDFDDIWASAYGVILNLNDLITNIDKYNALVPSKSNIIKGEAYGLRAMLHFDMLRLFGPVYSTNPDDVAIPYYTKAQASNGEFLSASEVIDMAVEDLKKAEEFLQEDIVREGIFEDTDEPFYDDRRNMRLNYFAIKALQARVYLYAGNMQEANTAAKSVINEATPFFPWTEPTDVISAGANPDRTFSSEVLLAIQNIDLYDRQREYFASSLPDGSILAPNGTRLSQVFENNENDYRYNSTWIVPTTGEKTFRTFFKYADVSDTRMKFRYLQPLIRISEMYYIVAETETDPNQGLSYLNTVRYNRGLVDLDPGADIDVELRKEYQKEFYGEGQLFFYYKRKNISSIPNGSSSSSWQTKSMGPDQYVLPLPDSETKYQ